MKRLCLATALALITTGCRIATEHGECIGIAGREDPRLVYEWSLRNAIVAIVFSETLIVPIIWAIDFAKCPEGKANPPTP